MNSRNAWRIEDGNESNLTEKVVRDFAARAAGLLLFVLDAEPAVPDPTELADAEVR